MLLSEEEGATFDSATGTVGAMVDDNDGQRTGKKSTGKKGMGWAESNNAERETESEQENQK